MPRARSEPGGGPLLPFSASFSLEHAELVSAVAELYARLEGADGAKPSDSFAAE